MTAPVTAATQAPLRRLSAEALAVMERFPPRPVPASWAATAADRFTVMRRMLAPPFVPEGAGIRDWRKLSMLKILDWLELHPGATWQQRWDACGAETAGTADWRDQMLASLQAAGNYGTWAGELRRRLGTGLAQLISGDVIRPGLPWLLTTTSPARVAAEMGRVRDPAGITGLKALREAAGTGHATFDPAVERIGLIMAAKGGLVADITPGDCIELLDCALTVFTRKPHTNNRHSSFIYQLLHTAGAFPPGAPATVRMISTKFAGPLTPEQMIARYDIACQPVRDLIVDYLRERQPGIDYSSLNQLAGTLGLRLWKDLETTIPASAPCTCRPTSPPPGSSGSRSGPSARPTAASSSSPGSQPTTS